MRATQSVIVFSTSPPEYPITRHQAGLVVDGAELELDLEHPMGVVVVCHLCEQPYALVEGQRCAGIP